METQARSPIGQLGDRTIGLVEELGELVLFSFRLLAWLVGRRPCHDTVLPTMYQVGVRSVPVVAITGTFIGMVLAVQGFSQFRRMKLETRIGSVINVSLVTELGPVLAATMLAGRIGSAMAAEIGTMKVTEQIDALRCLGTNPIHYLVVPRFLACVTLIPVLTVMADFMGIIGGAVVCIKFLNVDAYYYWYHSRTQVGMWDVSTGLLKTIFFGAEIAIISCFRGFRSTGGAEGVGRAATEAFVYSFIAILASDFFLGYILNILYDWLYPGAGSSITQGM